MPTETGVRRPLTDAQRRILRYLSGRGPAPYSTIGNAAVRQGRRRIDNRGAALIAAGSIARLLDAGLVYRSYAHWDWSASRSPYIGITSAGIKEAREC